ncbi:MAG: DNA protecting protein DprA [Ignavibacteria bacterium RBG_13_36_8]|nr:MAG: DNA protecting protein DprA [Ignavibacteria bacterium RBG_13_36_8]
MALPNIEDFIFLKLLLSVEGIGPGKVLSLLSKFKTPKEIFSTDFQSLTQVDFISHVLANRILKSTDKLPSIEQAVNIELEKVNKLSAGILTYWDNDYPELLRKIYLPPLILYTMGNFTDTDKFSIAVVGTRLPTNYGKSQAEKFSSELAKQNIVIVSGLARGIDSIAHKSTLKTGGRTIAVVGSGLDIIYPYENKKLFAEIIENGVVISEYEPGTKPDAQNFPKRNRIISGLALGTIIIETGINGGAMQTAAYALDQNREVFAIPGNLGIKQSEGTNILIQKGEAKLVREPEDVLIELELKLKPVIGKTIPKPDYELNLFEEKIVDVLNSDQLHIDDIATRTSLSTADCLVHLLSLEFKGVVKQLPGKLFMRI